MTHRPLRGLRKQGNYSKNPELRPALQKCLHTPLRDSPPALNTSAPAESERRSPVHHPGRLAVCLLVYFPTPLWPLWALETLSRVLEPKCPSSSLARAMSCDGRREGRGPCALQRPERQGLTLLQTSEGSMWKDTTCFEHWLVPLQIKISWT